VACDHVSLYDDKLFDRKDVFELDMFEVALSILAPNFELGDRNQLIIVGTGYAVPEEEIPTKGRLLVFNVDENKKLNLILEKSIKGAAFTVAEVHIKNSIAIGVGSKVYKVYTYITYMAKVSVCIWDFIGSDLLVEIW
jgi:DNA damage-binding protein 1